MSFFAAPADYLLAVPCPLRTCRAPKGSRCRPRPGFEFKVKVHQVRVRLAIEGGGP